MDIRPLVFRLASSYQISDTMTDGQSIVKKALEQLRSGIRPEDDRSFSDANLRDVWAVARNIENKQAARLTMRNMARIEPILRTLESYSGVMDTFCQGFSPMAFVWASPKCRFDTLAIS